MILLHREEEEVYVNPASIQLIVVAKGVGSIVTFTNGDFITVRETPTYIADLAEIDLGNLSNTLHV